jgi:hypothetical protein
MPAGERPSRFGTSLKGKPSLSHGMLRSIKNFINRPKVVIISIAKSIIYLIQDLNKAIKFNNRGDLFRHSISNVNNDGMFLEFGVFKGNTINFISNMVPDRLIFGFDSFEGMPEDYEGIPKGHYKLPGLPIVRENVKLVKGYFQDTLLKFLEEHLEEAAFIHIDAVLYSSTKYILDALAQNNRLQNGTVIQFDELFHYPDWWISGEYKAFKEFVNKYKIKFKYLGCCKPRLLTGFYSIYSACPVSIKIIKS